MDRNVILLALDSVGMDPLGHDRSESVYAESRFLFPRGQGASDILPITDAPLPGALVATDVIGGQERGAIECAITYTSIFSGQSAVEQHGLMRGLGLKEGLFKQMIARNNLYRHFRAPCLLNAVFPAHLPFFGGSYVEDLVPRFERKAIEEGLRFAGRPVRFKAPERNGFAELFTLAEINQNIFVHAAREAGVPLMTWDDVRAGRALTSTMTHELEAEFNVAFFSRAPLPRHTPQEAAAILVAQARQHDFTFYKYQIPDLVSHTGKIHLARQVVAVIEEFIEAVLNAIDPERTVVIVTSDHGHLEQLASSHAHPKSMVPTWYFGPEPEAMAAQLRQPENIFRVVTEHAKQLESQESRC
jgi:phosphopentomutase/2,3-bisphosphoglycerate-independent phosphoglycerate mutase family metalloenzyme